MHQDRRTFLQQASQLAVGAALLGLHSCTDSSETSQTERAENPASGQATGPVFQLSLAQWSLHKAIRDNGMDPLEFAAKARSLGFGAIEYVTQLYGDIAQNKSYLSQMKQRADDNGLVSHLIMIDHEGDLGSTNATERKKAVENHYKWVAAAKFLGCKAIRVNAAGTGTAEEVATAAIDGLGQLATFAQQENIAVVVENHGGYSSDGVWLSNVIRQVGLSNVGTLPDFGNFCIEKAENGDCLNAYDRYKGVQELLPFAKAVSAKSYDFNEHGEESTIDYHLMLSLCLDSGFAGYIGVEYEGNRLPEEEGILATKALVEKVGTELGYYKVGMG